MCIAAWIWLSHPVYDLLLLLNRDEYHSRPTRPVEWWGVSEEEEKILAGKDELGGGTWLGCTKNGRLAFLTNFREPGPHPSAKSRGELPVMFLQSKQSPMECATEIAKEAEQYNGFNLILADICSRSMAYISNRPKGNVIVEMAPPGFHVLSNANLDASWPKAQRLSKGFNAFLARHAGEEVILKEMVQELMTDNTKSDRSMLPITGVDPEWEYALSSIFIDVETKTGQYGTRSMAGIAVKYDGEVTFYEKYLESTLWKEHLTQFHVLIDRI